MDPKRKDWIDSISDKDFRTAVSEAYDQIFEAMYLSMTLREHLHRGKTFRDAEENATRLAHDREDNLISLVGDLLGMGLQEERFQVLQQMKDLCLQAQKRTQDEEEWRARVKKVEALNAVLHPQGPKPAQNGKKDKQ